jgi:glutathione S-transferase
MKLLASDTSPYARKTRIAAIEKGVALEVVTTNPLGEDVAALHAANPLGKIPALLLDDGVTLYDSRVICAYLDTLAPGPVLVPERGVARFDCLRREALADGVMDAAFNLVMEGRRPEAQRSKDWSARWRAGILRGVAAMEARDTFDLGAIASAAALGYLDFRLPDIGWRASTPMAAWWERVSARESVKATAPK